MTDDNYMQMALKLAERGIGCVEPNPAVGAVIVKDGQVIGKGRHEKFGGPHAEINALADCRKRGLDSRDAVMYVTLEPCCHHGKTGPCTQAIIEAGIAKVIVAVADPSAHAAGKGIEQLRRAEIEVQTGLCKKQAKLLNAPFFKFASTGKCWVTLKWAQTIDGKIAPADGDKEDRWISNELSRKDVHKLRRSHQAILVGINTVIADDPLLTARPDRGKQAVRVVLDNSLRIPLGCKLLSTVSQSPVMIVTSQNAVDTKPEIVRAVTAKGAEVLTCPETESSSNLHFLLEQLSHCGVTSLLVEGGAAVLISFLEENLVDQICVYIAPKILGGHGGVSVTESISRLSKTIDLQHVKVKSFGDNVRVTGLTTKAITELSLLSD